MKQLIFSLIAACITIFAAVSAPCSVLKKDGWAVCVSLSSQKTYVYEKGDLERILPCISGVPGTSDATPEGTYILNETGTKRGRQFYSPRYGDNAAYWVGFIDGTYVFRSVSLGTDGKTLNAAQTQPVQPSTHGSICFSEEDARWFYRNVPDGAEVHI